MGRAYQLLIFISLTGTALSNTLVELCRNNSVSSDCDERSLDCQNVLIAHLQDFMMHLDTKLLCLSLNNTHLTNIEEGVFHQSTSLRYLDLQGNMLSHLDHDLFTKLTELEYLDLSNNSITALSDERLFMSQQKLKVLKLSSNNIIHIDVKVLSPLRSIRTLSLSNNYFHCDCQILEILALCRTRGLNTSVICEEPKELEGYSWEIIEEFGMCNENAELLTSSSGESYLVPKDLMTPYIDSTIATVLLISLIVFIVVVICASAATTFYIRKKKNKIEPKSGDTVMDATARDRICHEEAGPLTPYIVGIELKGSRSSLQIISEEPNTSEFVVLQENLLDPKVLVGTTDKYKSVENPRYSGEYDNIR